MEMPARGYAHLVEDRVENDICKDLYGAYFDLSERYGFGRVSFNEFVAVYYDGFAATMRDEAIKMMEAVGMPLRPDGSDY